jgi:hypothetical protein
VLSGGSTAGSGNVCAATGTLSVPDFVARLHYEADPTGKDPQHNDQFSLGTFHLAGLYHQITQISVGGSGFVDPANLGFPNLGCGGGTCAAGVTNHDHGWAANAFVKFFVPSWPGTTLGSRSSAEADNLQFNALYCDGALEGCGIGATNGNFSAGDAYWSGGLVREDTDGRIINNGHGGYYIDKEKALAVNGQYHWGLTDCTDPVHCLVATAMVSYAWVTPGDITQNVDWTEGGLGKARKLNLTGEISWGTSRNGTTKPVFWRADFEVQYSKVWQDLPCNNNGNVGTGVCGLPIAIPLNITKDPSNWVWRTTITYNY